MHSLNAFRCMILFFPLSMFLRCISIIQRRRKWAGPRNEEVIGSVFSIHPTVVGVILFLPLSTCISSHVSNGESEYTLVPFFSFQQISGCGKIHLLFFPIREGHGLFYYISLSLLAIREDGPVFFKRSRPSFSHTHTRGGVVSRDAEWKNHNAIQYAYVNR
ncbi:hypothetical protein BU24DRAFT_56757 [Aaosphaeria arxii CBS 175.79]|uniref:Uncharacterized protein n=1 Tax=Aaosphaeria arxii CBS 175.79 TaxID=1450172 RepID=A0A6A5XBL8_9PLEO|nr:uncharacterized protein BU24DRAFT_56757 [Aaosphaeria arxii CBS 175.79]KAF2010348.1 hypothetical protein BU24DRAFT_56757 [Aaosphaeria arxii CBS 175.79]